MDIRLPVTPDFHINQFSGAGITDLESGITNGVIEQKSDRFYLTQRPSINVFEDAGTAGGAGRGRGIFYWEEQDAIYILNDGTLFKDTHASSISTSPTAGTKKCYFFVLGSTMILLNPESSEGFTVNTSDTVTEITDTDFPPKQATPVNLAYGGAVMDNYLFVMGTNGFIYHSDSGDATSWNALSFVEARRSEDAGVYLGKHHDNIVAMGSNSIEFLWDAGNSAGSVLSVRQDIQYNIGCATGEGVWEEGDRLFFIGVEPSGALGVYKMEQFGLTKVSNSTIDSFLTQAIVKNSYSAMGEGFTAQGHTYFLLTLYTTPSDITPSITLAFDDTTQKWGEWDVTINGITKFPLASWTQRQGSTQRYGEGILSNGDLITLNDNLVPQDTLDGDTYVTTGYVVTGYVAASSNAGTNIVMKSRAGQYDGGTNNYKYPESIRFVGNRTANSQTLTLRWANENNTTFKPDRTIDMSKNDKEHRLGRFQRRNHELEYSGSEQVFIEALEIPVAVGDD